MTPNNRLTLSGRVLTEPRFAYCCHALRFYMLEIEVPRLSGSADRLPVRITEEQCLPFLTEGETVLVEGELRSVRHMEEGRKRLLLFAHTCRIVPTEDAGENAVHIEGVLSHPPTFRETPLGRTIADGIVVVAGSCERFHRIPVIAWGRYARSLALMNVGDNLTADGRFQSRPYEKRCQDGSTQSRVAYELSCSSLFAL